MAKDIKGVFQIFLKINDRKKYKFNLIPDILDIFLSDNIIKEDLDKYEDILRKIDNFELLISNVRLFYINKNQEQDFFVVGNDEERKEYTVFFIWSSDTPAEQAILEEIKRFNSCINVLVKKSGFSSNKQLNIEIKGGEELIVFPASNYGNNSYSDQSIGDFYERINWLKIEKEENKLSKLDIIMTTLIIALSLIVGVVTCITKYWSLLMFFAGLALPILYEIIQRKILNKQKIKFTFNSLVNTVKNTNKLETLDKVVEVEDPSLVRGNKNE